MPTPAWRAPTNGAPNGTMLAGDVTQLLGTHPAKFLRQATQKVTGAASSTGTLGTNTGAATQWIAQPFTTAGGQTTVTRVELNWQIQGTGADVTVDLQSDSGGNPSGTVLATLTFPLDFEPGSAAAISIPLNAAGLSAGTLYHIVLHGTASTTNYAKVQRGVTVNTTALTSANGSTWAAAGVELLFKVFAGTNGVIRHTWEDSGARWTGLDYASGSAGTSGPPTTIREIVGPFRSVRTLVYTAGDLTSIS